MPEEEYQEPNAEPVEPTPQSGWNWIGSPDRPEAKENSDGISDLFDVEGDEEDDIEDATSVDINKDVMDANAETDDLSDLTDVFEEDVMGVDETGQLPTHKYLQAKRRAARARRESSPTGVRGIGY